MVSTEAFCRAHGVPAEADPPEIKGYTKSYARSAREVAVRTVILQGVVAAAAGVDPGPIVEWLRDQQVWASVTPEEQAFLHNASPTEAQLGKLGSHQEAEWTLLWGIGKVEEALGLPTRTCDTRRLCDEIIPALGSDIGPFIASANLRSPGLLLAEDDRTYDLWCYALAARRKGEPLPEDLNWGVLYERRYAFEWLDGMQDWDAITCDA